MADPNEYKVELAQVASSVDFSGERNDPGPSKKHMTNLQILSQMKLQDLVGKFYSFKTSSSSLMNDMA